MLQYFLKKIIPGVLILSVLISTTLFSYPKKTEAQFAVVDAGNIVQTTITAGNSVVQSASQYSIWLKEYVLDGLGMLVAKQIIRQITSSLVTWINSGFEGSPSFMQNPGAFFLDVADQITGDFLAKKGGPLTDLCSPFSIDIRLALAFKYRPNVQKRYSCTLGTIIKNSQTAIAGASINGFTAGDFKQGGMPAFISLSTEPQNNAYGAYLSAESELSIRVANASIEKDKELGAGRGFLSWRDPKCKTEVNAHNAEVDKNFQALEDATGSDYTQLNSDITKQTTSENLNDLYDGTTGETYSQTNKRIGGDVSQMNRRSVQDCPVQTPGSVIEAQLNNSLGGPLRELELADEINEIVNALFAQLVNTVLQKGLGAVTGSGPGDSTSYISQIQQEAQAANDTGRVAELKASMLSSMDTYIDNTYKYKSSKDSSLAALVTSKNKYEDVKSCYSNKIASNSLDSEEKSEAETRISGVDQIIMSKVTPLAAKAQVSALEADTRLKTLTELKTAVTTAKTVNDLNPPSQQYSLMAQEQKLTNAKDIVDAQEEYGAIKSQTDSFNNEAARLRQACDLFPHVR